MAARGRARAIADLEPGANGARDGGALAALGLALSALGFALATLRLAATFARLRGAKRLDMRA